MPQSFTDFMAAPSASPAQSFGEFMAAPAPVAAPAPGGGLPDPDTVLRETDINAHALAGIVLAQHAAEQAAPPPPPVPPLPWGLRTPQNSPQFAPPPDQPAPFGGMSPWQAGLEAAAGLDPTGIVPGAIRVGKGLFQTAHAPTGPEDIPAGLNQAFGGLMDAAQIGMIGGAVAAPVRTAASIGAGMLTQEGVQKGLVKMGMPAGWAEFVGNLAGIISGVGTHEAMSPKAVAAIKARVLPVLKARAEQAPPEQQFNSAGQPLYQAPAEPAQPPAQPVPAPVAPPVEPVAAPVTPKPVRTRTTKAAPKPVEPPAPEPPPPPVAAQVSEPTPAEPQTFTEFVKEKAAEHGLTVEETKRVFGFEEKTGEVVKVEPEAKPAKAAQPVAPETPEPKKPAQLPAAEPKQPAPAAPEEEEEPEPAGEILKYRAKGNDTIEVYIHEHPEGWTARGDFNLQGQAGGHLGSSGYQKFHPTRQAAIDAFLKEATRKGTGPQYTLDRPSAEPKLKQRAQAMLDWLRKLAPEPETQVPDAKTAARVASIDRQLEKLDTQYKKKMKAAGGYVPPAITGDALRCIANLMDKLEAERERLVGPRPEPKAEPLGPLTPEERRINPKTGKPWTEPKKPAAQPAPETKAPALDDVGAKALAESLKNVDVDALTEPEVAEWVERYNKASRALYDQAEKANESRINTQALNADEALWRAFQPVVERFKKLKAARERVEQAEHNAQVSDAADAAAFERATTIRPKNPAPKDIDARKNDPAPERYKIASYKNGNRLLIATGQPGIVQTFDTREWQWTDEYTGPVKKARERHLTYSEGKPISQETLDEETAYINGPWAEARKAGKTEVEAAPEPAPAITLSPAAQAAEAAHRKNVAERHRQQEAEEAAAAESLTTPQYEALSRANDADFAARAKEHGLEAAGPSPAGAWLVRLGNTDRAVIFGRLAKTGRIETRVIVPGLWTDENIRSMKPAPARAEDKAHPTFTRIKDTDTWLRANTYDGTTDAIGASGSRMAWLLKDGRLVTSKIIDPENPETQQIATAEPRDVIANKQALLKAWDYIDNGVGDQTGQIKTRNQANKLLEVMGQVRTTEAGKGGPNHSTGANPEDVPVPNPLVPSVEGFEHASKALAEIEKHPEYSKDTRHGMSLRDDAIERQNEIEFHRPAAVAKAQADIDREKGRSLGQLPKNAEEKFQTQLASGLADSLKSSRLTANPADVRATYEKLNGPADGNAATVGKRSAIIHTSRQQIGKGRSSTTRTSYRAIASDTGRAPLTKTFSEKHQAAAWATDKLHSLGVPESEWNEYGSMGGVTERFIRTGNLLPAAQSGLVASDAAGKAIGQPALSHDIYSQAFEGGWKGAAEGETLKAIAGRYAERLPRNESAITDATGRGDEKKTMLIGEQPPKEGYSDWEDQIEAYERAANGIRETLEGIRKRIAIAEYLNGGSTPRIAESSAFLDQAERNVEKNLEFVKQAARDETRKLSESLEPGARAAALAYAKYGEPAFENERTGTGAKIGLEALNHFMRIENIAGYDAALKYFAIARERRPNRIQIPDTGKGKLSKAEKEVLEKADLITGHIPFVAQGTIEKLRERGWATDTLTDEGKAAVYSYRMDKAEGAAGLPMSRYQPAKRPTLPAMEESRFAGRANAWNLVDGKVWHTNGHGAWKGEYPKNWPARDVNQPGPDIARVIPDEKGEPVEPIGFTRTEHKAGDIKRLVYFSNGAAMDADLYDYTNSLEPDLKWTQEPPKKGKTAGGSSAPFQARGKDGLRAVVMPMRVDRLPAALAETEKGATPAAETKAKNLESGSVQLDFLTLGLTKFYEQDVAPVLKNVASGIRDTSDDILKILAPTLRNESSQQAGLILRNNIAELARKSDQAQYALREAERYFNRQSAEDNFDMMDRIENGRPQKNPWLDQVAKTLRELYDGRRAEVRALGTGKLQNYYENYFAHIWEKPSRAKSVFAAFFGKRPLEGGKSFLKQRKYPTIADGRAAGLVPVSDNPVTLTLLKLREMDRYIMAHETLDDWKKAGLARFVDAREGKALPGWRKIEDPIGTVYGQSIQQINEYPNEGIYTGLEKVAEALGITHKRGFTNLRSAIGRAYKGGENLIRTMHGSREGTFAHEIGHQIDWLAGSGKRFVTEYPDPATVSRLKAAYKTLQDKGSTLDERRAARKELASLKGAIADRKEFQKQLRDLADLRGGPKSYVRSREEKMAQLAQMWAEGRELFERTAPKVFAKWKEFLDENPKLHALRDIEAGANATTLSQPYDVGGLVIKGHWWAPEGAASIMENYLSPGLRRFAGYRMALGLNNVLNQFQLGLSAFHLGFTAADTTVSKAALGFQALLRGHPIQAAKFFAQTPGAAFTTFLEGNRMLKEWYKPGSQGGAIGHLVDNLVVAGGRAGLDQMYRTQIADNMLAALRKGNILGAALRAPFAGVEFVSNLIMKEVVPRMKMGAFADMARYHLAELGPNATFEDARRVLTQDWNSIENRIGEMTYDNLFWNKIAKDLAMLSVRSVGWNLGTLREIGGGIGDVVAQPINALRGKPVNLNRLSYLAALVTVNAVMSAVYQKLKTGKGPDELTDYFFPKNGESDEAGNAQRVSWPTYVKDVYHYATHPLRTLESKVAPIWSAFAEMIHNQDFYRTQIRNPDDPLVKQLGEAAKGAAEQAVPIGVRNYQREKSLGASAATKTEQFIGISPAPTDLNQGPGERMAHEIAGEMPINCSVFVAALAPRLFSRW